MSDISNSGETNFIVVEPWVSEENSLSPVTVNVKVTSADPTDPVVYVIYFVIEGISSGVNIMGSDDAHSAFVGLDEEHEIETFDKGRRERKIGSLRVALGEEIKLIGVTTAGIGTKKKKRSSGNSPVQVKLTWPRVISGIDERVISWGTSQFVELKKNVDDARVPAEALTVTSISLYKKMLK